MPQPIDSPPGTSASVSVGAREAKAHRHRSVLFVMPPFPGFVVGGYSKVLSW
jgi:hypothetical protein